MDLYLFVGIMIAVSAVLFGAVYCWRRTSMLCGFTFLMLVGSVSVMLLMITTTSDNFILSILGVGILLLAFFLLTFSFYILLVFSFWNARIVIKKESRTLANSLTLFLGIGLVLMLVASQVLAYFSDKGWVKVLSGFALGVVGYVVMHIVMFLVTLFVNNLFRPVKRQDYIIVLGSGLINGEVPPLLGGRIDRAIKFYHAQAGKKGGKPPKLIMSGGQGADEPCPEGEAMKRYAITKGIPEEDVLAETKSTNTLQNMLYSKAIMDEREGGKHYRAAFSTNNYHVLRGNIYARKAGLQQTYGMGARTALYFLPNAVIREYIAYLKLHWKGNAILAFLAGLASGGVVLLGLLITSYY